MANQAASVVEGHTAVGVFVIPTEVISANAQVQVLAAIDVLVALVTGPVPGTVHGGTGTVNPMSSPNFANLPPSFERQLRAELATLRACIDAAPAV